MMRLPVPTAREVRWTFYIAAVSALALVGVLCWAIVQRVDQYDSLVGRLASDASQIERLTARDDEFRRERAVLNRQNRDIRAELRRSNRQFAALLRYLREQDIEVPAEIITRSGSTTRPKDPAPTGAPTPSPSPTPGPASPGPPPGTPSPSPGILDLLCGLVPLVCLSI